MVDALQHPRLGEAGELEASHALALCLRGGQEPPLARRKPGDQAQVAHC
ncbi:hypothetical protein [Cellulomonas denverensis]